MPPRPSTVRPLPTNVISLPLAEGDTTGVRRKQHVRRWISLPGLTELPHITDIPGFNLDIEPGEDTDDNGDVTDDEGPLPPKPPKAPPPPADPVPSPQPSIAPSPLTATAQADSTPTSSTTIGHPFFFTSTPEPQSTTSTTNASVDSIAPTTSTTLLPVPTISPVSTSTVAASIPSYGRPNLAPTNTALPSNAGPTSESKTVIAASVSMICITVFFGILYCLFRFCPPIRNRWSAFKARREYERRKRMGMDDSRFPPSVVVVDPAGQRRQSSWATAGSTTRNIGIENGVLRELDEAHLRPPSYRSHWTASGASWVANGFRVPGSMSQRIMSWSERSTRSRFMGRGAETRSTDRSGRSMADGLRPLGMNPYKTGGESRLSTSTIPATASATSLTSRLSRGGRQPSCGESDTRESSHSQGGFSTNARISDMSSLSAGTTTNAFRPPPLFKAPVGIARGSGNGLVL